MRIYGLQYTCQPVATSELKPQPSKTDLLAFLA
jgi:hypothetical protein